MPMSWILDAKGTQNAVVFEIYPVTLGIRFELREKRAIDCFGVTEEKTCNYETFVLGEG